MRKVLLIVTLLLSGILTLHAQSSAEKGYRQRGVENIIIDAVSLINNGEYSKALSLLNALAKEAPENDAVSYYQALCNFALGDDQTALACFERASAIDPSNEWYKESLASSYLSLGRNTEAIQIYKQLVKNSPSKFKNAKTLCILADEAVRGRKDSLARAYYNEALEMSPEYTPALYGMSDLHLRSGEMLSYFSIMNRIMRDENTNPEWKTQYLRNFIKYVDAVFYKYWGSQLDSLVAGSVQASPTDTSALHLAGEWFYSTGYKERGINYFNRWAELYPKDYNARMYQMQLALFEGENDKSLSLCDTLLSIVGKDKEKKVLIYSTKGDVLHELGREKECFDQYKKALRLNPDYVPVLNNYAYFLCEKGVQLKKALKMSAKTIKLEPDNSTYLDTYGWILHLLGKDEDAEPVFKHAIATGGNESKVILEHYADILDALGKADRASFYRKLAGSSKSK